MNYPDYEAKIKCVPYAESLEYTNAVLWLHRDMLPLGVVSVGEDAAGIIKIPFQTKNAYGRTVPVIAIAADAFKNRKFVTDIILPPTIERIPKGAFKGCTELKRITIPKKIKIIPEGTFEGCEKLEDVYFEGSTSEWNKIKIVHEKHSIEFEKLIDGTPVQKIKAETLTHLPGNDAVLLANIHFNCTLSGLSCS